MCFCKIPSNGHTSLSTALVSERGAYNLQASVLCLTQVCTLQTLISTVGTVSVITRDSVETIN